MTDHAHELDLLGAALIAPGLTATIDLTEPQFVQPTHGHIWEAIRAIHTGGRTPDPALITAHLRNNGVTGLDHGTLVQLVGRGLPANADLYADQIRDHHHRRTIDHALTRAHNQLKDPATPAEDVLAQLSTDLDTTTIAEQAAEGLETLDEFLDKPIPPEDWIIPNLIARGDRTVITGLEGLGKTTLIRQIGVCAAAGFDPFAWAAIPTRRVLYVDVENPRRIMAKSLAQIRAPLIERNRPADDRFWVQRWPQGLDLGRSADRLKLHALCELVRPDLLIIGPAYKLYVGGGQIREEDLARQVTSALDHLREHFQFALILEHHSPHGGSNGERRTVRPIGSSLWMRWPEFGFGLTPADGHTPARRIADVVHWRGGRDDRPWPTQLVSGDQMPWDDANPPTYRRHIA